MAFVVSPRLLPKVHGGKSTLRASASFSPTPAIRAALIVVLSATDSATEAQQDASLRHGIFTYAPAKGLNGKADLMKKGAVNITGLFNFVSSEVYDLSKGEQNRPSARRA